MSTNRIEYTREYYKKYLASPRDIPEWMRRFNEQHAELHRAHKEYMRLYQKERKKHARRRP